MIIKSIYLKNYRNHKDLKLELSPKINLITGANGVGKTNILEAIHLLSTTKSFRARFDRDLINHDESFTKVEARIIAGSQLMDIEGTKDNTKSSIHHLDTIDISVIKSDRSVNTSSKKVKINNVPKTLSSFSHSLKTVLFSPEDIETITGSPSNRRKYLDMVLIQTIPSYKKSLNIYQNSLKRRNKLLESIKETHKGLDQLPFWNNKILESGEFIQQIREDYLLYVNAFLASVANPYSKYANKLNIKYKLNKMDSKRLLEYKEKEIQAKTTLIGPHRDDLSILQSDLDMAQFSSRGEQRTAMFLLKLAEFNYINTKLETSPVLLLDDIFSELDEEHKQAILSFINDQQTVITTAYEKDLPSLFISKTIHLS